MTTEIIEGQATEIEDEPVRAVVAVQHPPPSIAHVQSGLGAIANLPDDEFEENLARLKKAVTRARRMQEALLEDGTDYGSVKGVKRPFLHKPGAEKFEKAYGLATSYTVERHVGDGEETPELEFIVHARVHLGSTDGPVVGEGLGSANNWETKYRYRTAPQAKPCPDCGKMTVIRLNPKAGRPATWWCGKRDGGCGHTFAIDDPRFGGEDAEKIENPDPWDLANTLLKMARKRAYVDGMLTATGTSGLFTQDEDAPIVPRADAVAPVATGPAEPNPASSPDSPAEHSGELTKIDPEDGMTRQVKIKWLDNEKAVHQKLELKVKTKGRNLTAILVDQLALAAAAVGLRNGDLVSFGGTVEERIWQEGKPPIKEVRNPPALWYYRGGGWKAVGPAPAAPEPEPIDYEAEESAILDDLVVPPTWEEQTKGLRPMLVRQGEEYRRTGFLMDDLSFGQNKAGLTVINGNLGVPHEGIFHLVCGDGEAANLTTGGAPNWKKGDEIAVYGRGHITPSGAHIIILDGAGKPS